MNNLELQELVRRQLGGTATAMAAQLALNAVLNAISDGLQLDGSVKIARFGTFRIQQRASRRLLLPGSKRELTLPPRKTITFKQAPGLKSAS